VSDVFDPAEHNVDDVLAYVEENPDEREAVFDKEKEGKARVTLLEALGEEPEEEEKEEEEEESATPGVDDGVLAETAAGVRNAIAEAEGMERAKQAEIDLLSQSDTDDLDAQISAKEAELETLREARENAG
jgi:hypothetical protein